jgi:hypothetical protein
MEEKKGETIETYNPAGSDIESNERASDKTKFSAGAGLKRQLKNRHVTMIRNVTAVPPMPLQADNSQYLWCYWYRLVLSLTLHREIFNRHLGLFLGTATALKNGGPIGA